MINCIPNDILLIIYLYIDRVEDLFNFLDAIEKHEYFDEICVCVFLHYIKKLNNYYRYTKRKGCYDENDPEFYFYYYLYSIANNNLPKSYSSEDIPYDNTNEFTCLCSEIIKEYSIIIEYPIKRSIISSIKLLIHNIKINYNDEKDITFLTFIK
jgi:hypothetical protein